MTILYPPLYPQLLPVECHDDDSLWLHIKDAEETGYHESMAPRKYKITDYRDGVPQFQAIVTQKNQVGQPHHPFSTVTIRSYELLDMIDTKILSFPDIRKMILLYPGLNPNGQFRLCDTVESITILLERFDTLQSLVLPIEFMVYLSIPVALEHHLGLTQLELVLPTSRMRSELGLTIVLGLSDLRDRLQKLIIPPSILTPELLRFLGNMENLKYLMIKSWNGSGGNHFVDMISEHGISSEHAFHALRILDVGVKYTHPSKLRILWRHFPDIQYL